MHAHLADLDWSSAQSVSKVGTANYCITVDRTLPPSPNNTFVHAVCYRITQTIIYKLLNYQIILIASPRSLVVGRELLYKLVGC